LQEAREAWESRDLREVRRGGSVVDAAAQAAAAEKASAEGAGKRKRERPMLWHVPGNMEKFGQPDTDAEHYNSDGEIVEVGREWADSGPEMGGPSGPGPGPGLDPDSFLPPFLREIVMGLSG